MTSKQWYNKVKKSEKKLNDWLNKQYRGEVTAADRIRQLIISQAPSKKAAAILEKIAVQEENHAEWVLGLLKARGINPDIAGAEQRYWKIMLPMTHVSFNHASAVAAHAEKMRLERIQVIVNDKDTADDIRKVFKRILKQEIFHESAFRKLAGEEAMKSVKPVHNVGLRLLGLSK